MKLNELSELYDANVEPTHIQYFVKISFNSAGCVYKDLKQEFPKEYQPIVAILPIPPEETLPEKRARKKHEKKQRERWDRMTDDEVKHVKLLWKNGLSRQEIADKLNRSFGTVWKLTK